MSERNDGSFVGGLITGAIIGFVLGILFAPASGDETRKILGEKSKELLQKGKELLQGETVEIEEE